MDSFFNNMKNWSSQDFKDFNEDFLSHMRERARLAYENGDFETYNTMTEVIEQYDADAAAIWNDPNMTDEEKRRANEKLINDLRDKEPEFMKDFLVSHSADIANKGYIKPETKAVYDQHNEAENEMVVLDNFSSPMKSDAFDFN